MNFANAKSKLSTKSKSQKQKSVTTPMNKPSPTLSPTNLVKPIKPCQGCGNSHWKKDCPFKDAECHKCKRKGHIAKVCFSKNTTNSLEVLERDTEVSSSTSSVPTEYLYYNDDSINSNSPFYKYVNVDGVNVPFQVDTGAARTAISKSVFGSFSQIYIVWESLVLVCISMVKCLYYRTKINALIRVKTTTYPLYFQYIPGIYNPN